MLGDETVHGEEMLDGNLAFVDNIPELAVRLRSEVAQVIVVQDEVVKEILVALLAGGHAILEGVPGLAKTSIVSSLAESMRLSFRRIQFTPDLMPSDITLSLIHI